MRGEQRTRRLQWLPARNSDEGLECYIYCGQEIMQQPGMREQRPRCFHVRACGWRLRVKFVDAFLQRLGGLR